MMRPLMLRSAIACAVAFLLAMNLALPFTRKAHPARALTCNRRDGSLSPPPLPAAVATPPAEIAALADSMSVSGLAGLASSVDRSQDLMVTFGTSSLAPFVSNWLSSLAMKGVTNILVGALDEQLYQACLLARVPVERIDLHKSGSAIEGDAGYIRKDYDRFKQMGKLKVQFLNRLLEHAPNGVWVCDADMVFLRPPTRSLVENHDLGAADVLLSTDCLDLPADERGECARTASFNTGVMYLRNTKAARNVVQLWADRMEHVGPEPWLDDQAVLNDILRPGLVQRQPPGATTSGKHGKPVSRTYIALDGRAIVGLLPLASVANGHTFFVQQPCAFCRSAPCGWCTVAQNPPIAVHTTYQFGDSPQFAYGKRARLVQAGLWSQAPYDLQAVAADGSQTSAAAASTRKSAEEQAACADHRCGDGRVRPGERFVVLDETAINDEMHATVRASQAENSDSPQLIRIHQEYDALWRRRVLALLATAIETNRTAVLPPTLCFCDTFWGALTRCRVPAASGMALPFECPLDHVIDLPAWATQNLVRWQPPRFLQHYRHFLLKEACHQVLTLSLPSIDSAEAARCSRAARAHGEVPVRSHMHRLATLLRHRRLFCHVEGAAPSTGDAAPCCTNHSLRTAWTSDSDPRGRGFYPCSWGFPALDAVEVVPHLRGRVGCALPAGGTLQDGQYEPGAFRKDDERGKRPSEKSPSSLLAVCVLPSDTETKSLTLTAASSIPDEAALLLQNWVRHATIARGGLHTDILIISADAKSAEVARQEGVLFAKIGPTSSAGRGHSWASVAAGCVEMGMNVSMQMSRTLILTTAAVTWLRDPSEWAACLGDGSAQLECAPLGPADVLIASDMLSVKQDALFGGGYAKWGALDPSVLMFRNGFAARAMACAWRTALLHEHSVIVAAMPQQRTSSWAKRAGALFRSLLTRESSGSVPLEELPITGVRQPSRLFAATIECSTALEWSDPAIHPQQRESSVAIVGVLPIGLFPTGHSYWVQHAQRDYLGLNPYAIRPQLAPLSVTSDTARAVRHRLILAGLWGLHNRGSPSFESFSTSMRSTTRSVELQFSKEVPLTEYQRLIDPSLQLTGGLAALAAHAAGLIVQLRMVRYAAGIAVLLGRTLLVPALACYCDRDPSGDSAVTGLLANGCQLPSTEAEAYLPFTCPPSDVMDDNIWEAVAGYSDGGSTSVANSVYSGFKRDTFKTLVEEGLQATELVSRLRAMPGSQHADRIVLQMDAHQSAMISGRQRALASAAACLPSPLLEEAFLRGPAGGWCLSCSQVEVPDLLLTIGVKTGHASTCRFCLNFTRIGGTHSLHTLFFAALRSP